MKATTTKQVRKFQDIPNVGTAMERDFRALGLTQPADLINKNPLQLYKKICTLRGKRQDPCVLDTYLAVVDFMNGAPARPWFYYTKNRKREYPDV